MFCLILFVCSFGRGFGSGRCGENDLVSGTLKRGQRNRLGGCQGLALGGGLLLGCFLLGYLLCAFHTEACESGNRFGADDFISKICRKGGESRANFLREISKCAVVLLYLVGKIVCYRLLYLNFIQRAREYNNFSEIFNEGSASVELSCEMLGGRLFLFSGLRGGSSSAFGALIQNRGSLTKLGELLLRRLALLCGSLLCLLAGAALALGVVLGSDLLGALCCGFGRGLCERLGRSFDFAGDGGRLLCGCLGTVQDDALNLRQGLTAAQELLRVIGKKKCIGTRGAELLGQSILCADLGGDVRERVLCFARKIVRLGKRICLLKVFDHSGTRVVDLCVQRGDCLRVTLCFLDLLFSQTDSALSIEIFVTQGENGCRAILATACGFSGDGCGRGLCNGIRRRYQRCCSSYGLCLGCCTCQCGTCNACCAGGSNRLYGTHCRGLLLGLFSSDRRFGNNGRSRNDRCCGNDGRRHTACHGHNGRIGYHWQCLRVVVIRGKNGNKYGRYGNAVHRNYGNGVTHLSVSNRKVCRRGRSALCDGGIQRLIDGEGLCGRACGRYRLLGRNNERNATGILACDAVVQRRNCNIASFRFLKTNADDIRLLRILGKLSRKLFGKGLKFGVSALLERVNIRIIGAHLSVDGAECFTLLMLVGNGRGKSVNLGTVFDYRCALIRTKGVKSDGLLLRFLHPARAL